MRLRRRGSRAAATGMRARRRYFDFLGAGLAAFFGVLQQAIEFLLAPI